jgi:hypothetical protein
MGAKLDTRGYAKVKEAARYAGVSPRTLRKFLRQGLKHARLPTGTMLIRYGWIDEFLGGFKVETGQDRLDKLVEEVTRELVSN